MDFSNLGLAALVVFVIPGFISNRIYRAIYTVKTDSEWVIAANGFISSLWIFTALAGLDNLFHTSLIEYNSQDSTPKYGTIFVLLVSGYLWGYCRAGIHWLKYYLSKKFKQLSFLCPDPGSIWALLNQDYRGYWSKVTLTDQTIYLGWMSCWSHDPDKDDFDFFLINAARVNDSLERVDEIEGPGIYLNTRNVLKIELLDGTSKDKAV